MGEMWCFKVFEGQPKFLHQKIVIAGFGFPPDFWRGVLAQGPRGVEKTTTPIFQESFDLS